MFTNLTTSVMWIPDLEEWSIAVHGIHRAAGPIGWEYCGYVHEPSAADVRAIVAKFKRDFGTVAL